jgi:uncharacterized protein (DUF433 family)
MDEQGVLRIGDSRLTLDAVLDCYHQGMAAEVIAEGFDGVVELADVHAVLAYYLRHRAEIDAYLSQLERAAEAMRCRVEAEQTPRPAFREELLNRQAMRKNGGAQATQ